MKDMDRFHEFDDDVRQLVLDFESTVMKGEMQFYDVDECEMIIDYYLEVEDREALREAIRYAEKLYPESTEIKIRRAHWFIAEGSLNIAEQILKALEEKEPENTDVAYSLGVLYGERGEHEKSVDYFLKAATDGWQLGRIYGNIAEEYVKMEDWIHALQYYTSALTAEGYENSLLYGLLDMCTKAEMEDEAISVLDYFLGEHPYSKDAWYCMGCARRSLGMFEQAEEAFELAIAIDKEFIEAYAELADLQEQTGRHGEAATTYGRMLDTKVDKGWVYRNIGLLFFRNENFETALLYLRKALAEHETDAEVHADMGLCYLKLGDISSAKQAVRRARRIDSESVDALLCEALAYDMDGEKELALDTFEHLASLATCPENHFRCFIIFLYENGYYEQMEEHALVSLEICPHDVFYSTYLAAVYYRTNRYNRLQHMLADVELANLTELCPEILQTPVLIPLLEEMSKNNKEK